MVIIGLLARTRFKVLRREVQKTTELADHREYERNLAQQELMHRLEEERELAKEGIHPTSLMRRLKKLQELS